MILIVSGNNIPNSRALRVSETLKRFYEGKKEAVTIIDISTLPLSELKGNTYLKDKQPSWLVELNKVVMAAKGLVFVVPEFNGSYPGVLKTWIDHWPYPEGFRN